MMNDGRRFKVSERVPFITLHAHTHIQCVLSVGFSELRMRNSEHELLDRWSQDHPCERLLDIG